MALGLGLGLGLKQAIIQVLFFGQTASAIMGLPVPPPSAVSRVAKFRFARKSSAGLPQPSEKTQILHHDRIFVVAGLHSRWSSRRKIDLTELATEPWGLPSPDTLAGSLRC